MLLQACIATECFTALVTLIWFFTSVLRPILAEMAPGHRMASSQPRKDFGGDFHDPGCTWAKCGKKFSFDKTQISSKVIFFYLPVKMNRMAKIWCTVPRMIFVGGFTQPAVHSTGTTAKKHFYQNLSKPVF